MANLEWKKGAEIRPLLSYPCFGNDTPLVT